jgi:hypothetical protein
LSARHVALMLLGLVAACTAPGPTETEPSAASRQVLQVDGFRASLPPGEAAEWYILPERRSGDMAEHEAVRDLGERHRLTANIIARSALTPATAQTTFDERVLEAPVEALPDLYAAELLATLEAIAQTASEPGSGMRVVASRIGARSHQAAAGATCVELTQRMEAPTTPPDQPAVRIRETTYTCFHPERHGSMVALIYGEEWYGTVGEASPTFNAEAAAFLDSLAFD